MNIELTCCELVIENESSMPEISRDKLAETYAMALISSWPTDWKRANAAILKRWPKGLNYIKNKAHKIVEGHRREAIKRLAEAN